LLKRCVEQAHRESTPELDASTYHLAVQVASDYAGMLIALEPQGWRTWSDAAPGQVVDYLLQLARRVSPRSIATAKRGPKKAKPRGYVAVDVVRQHIATARVLRKSSSKTP
jgi:hypothetical protein